ncbi:MAG TPA: M20/M25/M40 family metallo-hydrolase, partial [Thermodesulfobacteriota bacterium]|nr:M20/M25/M40 family metallo-hydrolase [Thermodesulfobacteriota bacterium]
SCFISNDFISGNDFTKIEPQRLKEHLSYLISSEAGGRLPETPGYEKAQAYLIKQLEGMGLTPVVQPFSITVKDIKESALILKTSNKEEKIRAIPFRFSKRGRWEGLFILIDPTKAEEMEQVSGKGAMIFLDLAKDLRSGQLSKKVKELQAKGARAVLFFVKEEDLDVLAPCLTYPSYFPPKLEERLLERERNGSPVQRSMEASKVAARAKEPDFSINLPILFVPYSRLEEDWIKTVLDQKQALFEASVEFKETKIKDVNIGGLVEGRDPEKKREFLLLSAHYDHPERDEKSGVVYSGADDNPSGVSALLEVGRSLIKKKADLKRSTVLLFFGGEEWGQWGSRDFVSQPFVPLAQIKAMFCLDTLRGVTGEKEVFLAGSSANSSLARMGRKFVEPLGMKEGKNDDVSLFGSGRDRFAFYEKGIPTLDFLASDARKVHSSRDHLDSVDFEKWIDMTKLIYLTAYEFLTEP